MGELEGGILTRPRGHGRILIRFYILVLSSSGRIRSARRTPTAALGAGAFPSQIRIRSLLEVARLFLRILLLALQFGILIRLPISAVLDLPGHRSREGFALGCRGHAIPSELGNARLQY